MGMQIYFLGLTYFFTIGQNRFVMVKSLKAI